MDVAKEGKRDVNDLVSFITSGDKKANANSTETTNKKKNKRKKKNKNAK